MKKILMMVLCAMLAFGVMSGCAKTPTEVKLTEEQKINELKEVVLNTSYCHLIAEGGFKITEIDGEAKRELFGKKDGEKTVIKVVDIEDGKEAAPFYKIDGFSIEEDSENAGEYKAGSYNSLETPVSEVALAFLMSQYDVKLTETDAEKTLQIIANFGSAFGQLITCDFKFTADKKLKSINSTEQNSSDKIETVIERGVQSFETPAKMLEVKIDSIVGKSYHATEKAMMNELIDVIKGNTNYKASETSGGITTSVFITNDYIVGDENVITKDGSYEVSEKDTDGVKTKKVKFDYAPSDFSYAKYMASALWSSPAWSIIAPNSVEGAAELKYVESGNTITISRGEEKIVLEGGKVKQVDYEANYNGVKTIRGILYEYGNAASKFPTEIETYMATDAHKAVLKAYNRLGKMNLYELKKVKGVKIVVTSDKEKVEQKFDFSGNMDKGITTSADNSTYVYGYYAYSIVEGKAEETIRVPHLTALDLVDQIGSVIDDGATVQVTDSAIDILVNGKVNIRLTVAENGFVTKNEVFKNEVVFGTAEYTYGEQTIEIPKEIIDFVKAKN